jgi:nucleoside-diphosphate-sugar epimerase
MLFEARDRDGLPLTIIRPAHTYGRGGKHRGHVVHSLGKGTAFLDRLRKGKPVVVHGDGSSFWTSCHLEDVARGFAGAIGNPRTLGRTYHVTGEEWLTWNRYHQLVAQAMDAPEPQLVHIPTDFLSRVAPEESVLVRENFQFNNIFDNSAAHRDLGFRYTIPFLEGMRDTIAWVERTYGFDNSDSDRKYEAVLALWQRVGDLALQQVSTGAA